MQGVCVIRDVYSFFVFSFKVELYFFFDRAFKPTSWLAADDPRQQLLRYMILAAKDAPLEQQIHSLESYCNEELDEKWLYRLAELYHAAGNQSECVRICDKIMLLFGLGKYVDKAMELKQEFAPLTDYQMDLVENRDKYEQKLRRVEQEFGSAPAGKAPQEE